MVMLPLAPLVLVALVATATLPLALPALVELVALAAGFVPYLPGLAFHWPGLPTCCRLQTATVH